MKFIIERQLSIAFELPLLRLLVQLVNIPDLPSIYQQVNFHDHFRAELGTNHVSIFSRYLIHDQDRMIVHPENRVAVVMRENKLGLKLDDPIHLALDPLLLEQIAREISDVRFGRSLQVKAGLERAALNSLKER